MAKGTRHSSGGERGVRTVRGLTGERDRDPQRATTPARSRRGWGKVVRQVLGVDVYEFPWRPRTARRRQRVRSTKQPRPLGENTV